VVAMHTPDRRFVLATLLFCFGLSLAPLGHVARADDQPAAPSAEEVRAALGAFGKAVRSKKPDERAAAVRKLGTVRHESVAARLLKLAKRESDAAVLAVTFETLGEQKASAKKVVSSLTKRLKAELDAEAKRIKRGRNNFRLNPRTGEADPSSKEGLAALAATEQRAVMVLAILNALDALGWMPGKKPPDLTPFLQDPHDDLAVVVLQRLGAWKAWHALPQMHFLYRMYPSAELWETGAVNQAGGTPASAKAAWMKLFGHPGKQRGRPKVHAALMAALKAITGEDFASPDALGKYIRRKDVKARIKGKR